jgi:hypothetical protein
MPETNRSHEESAESAPYPCQQATELYDPADHATARSLHERLGEKHLQDLRDAGSRSQTNLTKSQAAPRGWLKQPRRKRGS